jgi:gamma-glutamylcyclotransferase (GGCT)/AIG2-like uncharacterized protein YtfP
MSSARDRLAVYGSLAPGRRNHDQLEDLPGTWTPGHLRGTVVEIGWGDSAGYPGLILDPDGPEVPVLVFESPELYEHWERLDAFEGDAYERVVVDVATDRGASAAYVYALRGPAQRGRPT